MSAYKLVASGVLLAVAIGALRLIDVATAHAATPVGQPVFSASTTIDNLFFPVFPGAVQVFVGRDGKQRITVVERHQTATRRFVWGDQDVECRIIEEHTFANGRLVELETAYYAQADDGSVYFFGETGENEDDDDHEGSGWVVGQLSPGDPEDTASADAPTLFMPATPEIGDRWNPEELPPLFLDTFEVKARDARVRVRLGTLGGALRVRETSPGEDESEMNWFVPGLGLVKRRSHRFRLRLQATTLDVGTQRVTNRRK